MTDYINFKSFIMKSTFRHSEDINNDGSLKLIHVISDDTGDIDVIKKFNDELGWCKENVIACSFSFLPKSNYFGAEITFNDHNGTLNHISVYTKLIEDNIHIESVILTLQGL